MSFALEIRAKDLAGALARLGEVTPGNSSLPILNNVMLSCRGGELELAATNLDQALNLSIAADGTGVVTTELRQLTAIASRIDGESPVTLRAEGEDKLLQIKQRRSTFRLPTLPAADFPAAMTEAIDGEGWEVPGVELATALRMLEPACANDSRPYLNGARFDTEGDGTMLVATDGFRLGSVTFSATAPAGFPAITLPQAAMRAAHALAKRAERVRISASETALTFEDGTMARLRTRVIGDTYPDWRRVVPATAPVRVRVKTAALEGCVSRVGAIRSDTVDGSKGKVAVVRLELAREEIVVTSRGAGGAEGTDACPSRLEEGEPPGLSIELNADFLAWALASLGDVAEIDVGTSGPISAVTLCPVTEPAARMCLLMPRRG